MANHLPVEKKSLILQSLVEGSSINSVVRLTGVSKVTILRLLVEAGQRAAEIMDSRMMNLRCDRIQVDEIWTFVQKKQKHVKAGDGLEPGDQYVFIAMDADTKLVPCFRVGKRDGKRTRSFLMELATRVSTRFQLSTDSFKPYFDTVDRIWGKDIDYAQIHKEYAESPDGEKRYSPARIIHVTKTTFLGEPDPKYISTSYVERQNLTIRMQMRRFTRLTNAFSKKLRNLEAAVALHFFHYNFMRIHQSLRVTPGMQAGISRHVWTWAEFLGVKTAEQRAA